jgi:transposase
MGHRQGENREQAALFPVMLDELVEHDSLVRVIDAWVGSLELAKLGFAKAMPQRMGTPPYDPADLLKLYIWGYLDAVRSSRGLERECHRNVECMWLMRRLAPDHKTIADFRRNNAQPLVAVCAAFVQFARTQRLIAGATVAIDGTKIRAVASRKAVVGRRELEARAKRNAQEIEEYLKLLDSQDAQEAAHAGGGGEVRQALQELERQRDAIQTELQQLTSASATQVRGEEDAQVMRSLHGAPGYNLQTAVESGSHLIVAHEVTSEANDKRQLAPMARAASQALGLPCIAIADTGYANGEQIGELQEQGMTTYVAVKRSVNNQGGGDLYDRTAFTYDRTTDSYCCPADKLLVRKKVSKRDKQVIYAARQEDCGSCSLKSKCTNAKRRSVSRHFYEEALEANAQRMAERPEMMTLRRQTVEHPFDFIKNRVFVNARLLLRGKSGAAAESSLAVLAYNIKRVFNMKGGNWMRSAMQG